MGVGTKILWFFIFLIWLFASVSLLVWAVGGLDDVVVYFFIPILMLVLFGTILAFFISSKVLLGLYLIWAIAFVLVAYFLDFL